MKTFLSSVLIVVFVVSSWTLAYFILFEDQLSRHIVLKEQNIESQCGLKELKNLSKKDSKLHREAEIQSLKNKLIKRVPITQDTGSLLDLFSKISQSNDLKLSEFNIGHPDPSKTEKGFLALPVSLSIQGEFPKILNLMKEVSLNPRLMTLSKFSFKDSGAHLQYLAYFGESKYPVNAILDEPYRCSKHTIEANFQLPLKADFEESDQMPSLNLNRNPFVSSKTQILDEGLHLVGVIQEGEKWIALIEDSMGAGQVVRVGDLVLKDYRVQKITTDYVRLSGKGWVRLINWEASRVSKLVR